MQNSLEQALPLQHFTLLTDIMVQTVGKRPTMRILFLTILNMIFTLLPVILAGISVMVFVKLPVLTSLLYPLDQYKVLKDGYRLFGDHKTWKGIVGYLLFTPFWTLIQGLLIHLIPPLKAHSYLYVHHENTLLYNLLIGLALGFAYALFELPNSFIKRRLGIQEGKTASGPIRYLFIFIDQADSVIGCVLVLSFVYPMSFSFFILYILLGAAIHILFNFLLQVLGLRKERR